MFSSQRKLYWLRKLTYFLFEATTAAKRMYTRRARGTKNHKCQYTCRICDQPITGRIKTPPTIAATINPLNSFALSGSLSTVIEKTMEKYLQNLIQQK